MIEKIHSDGRKAVHRTDREAERDTQKRLVNFFEGKPVVSDKKIDSEDLPEDIPEEEMKRALDFFWSRKEELYRRAYYMQRKVIWEHKSYRNYGVGSAAVAYNRNTKEILIIDGYNEKEADDIPKHCGEMKIVEKARELGFTKIIGMVVVAEPQEDPSEVECTTLHPCRECKNMLSPHMGGNDRPGNDLTWDGMPVATFSIPADELEDMDEEYVIEEELHTLGEMIAKHDEGFRRQGKDPTVSNFQKKKDV